jgi:hypothetical protein
MKIFTLLFAALPFCSIIAQHLPLQISNQWHYDAFPLPGMNYAAIAVDTVTINNMVYFEIERRHYNTGELLETTYDRLQGDSAYFRIRNGNENLLINFNWPDGYTQVVQTDSCYDITIMNRWLTNFWGFNTEVFVFTFGFWCEGMVDTAWVLTQFRTNRMFGCELGYDGWIRGAIIDGTTYGTLHPLPVELVSFAAEVTGNNVLLNWVTASEINNRGFEIQRVLSTEYGVLRWEVIGFVEGHGTTTETNFYSFIDENLSQGKYQYRFKQIDFDGTFEYSNVIEIEVELPQQFALYQNYPNPFNPSTKIKYAIPNPDNPLHGATRGGLVTLKVYDILGNEVATLVNEEKQPGIYEIEFDASDLTSGIYFYRLKSDSFVQTRKMMLIR